MLAEIMRITIKLCIVILLFLSFVLSAQERREKVLILHSYHQGLEWTDNITQGILSQFNPLHNKYDLYFDYLDTKRNRGPLYWQSITELMYLKHQNIDYSLVIIVDNNALKFVNQHTDLFPNNPLLIFCGINNYNDSMLSNLPNIAGVPEFIDFDASLAIIARFHPDKRKVLVIHDQMPTSKALKQEFVEHSKKFSQRFSFEFFSHFSLEGIKHKLSSLPEDTLIYLLPVNMDKNNTFISYTESLELITQNTRNPVYSPWQMYMNKGVVGGKMTSGFEQGKTAAELALLKFQQQDSPEHPNQTTLSLIVAPTINIFDYSKLLQYDISLDLLPPNSMLINRPQNWYQKYGTMLEYLLSALIILFLFVSFQNIKQRKILNIKRKASEQLEAMVKQRTQELAKANKELKTLSNIDGLTQLYNRRYLDSMLNKEVNRAIRHQHSLALLICDIDYFKKYNDYYGHLAGDDCIKKVAEILKSISKRSGDVAARYGGEEFCLILPNTNLTEVMTIADKIQQSLADLALPHEKSTLNQLVTLSIGVFACIPPKDTSAETFISCADQALYASKANGRNKISSFDMSSVETLTQKEGA